MKIDRKREASRNGDSILLVQYILTILKLLLIKIKENERYRK